MGFRNPFRANPIGVGKIINETTVVGASHSDNTLAGKVKTLEEHIHKAAKCYPASADPVEITSQAGVWAGHNATKTEIMPDGVETKDLDIHWVSLSGLSLAGQYELKLYAGEAGSEVEITCIPFTKDTDGLQTMSTLVLASGNQRISASLDSGTNPPQTVDVKIGYHTY